MVLVACGVRFFFHFQCMLTINHSRVQIADATKSADALDTSRLARQMPNSHVTVSLFAVFLTPVLSSSGAVGTNKL